MILEFSLRNFRSYLEDVTLDMTSIERDKQNLTNTVYLGKQKIRVNKLALLYGSNAAGKTNVIKGLQFMKRLVMNDFDVKPGDPIPVSPFAFQTRANSTPSSFEIHFVFHSIKYIYGFSVTKEEVVEEYLYYFPKGKKNGLFERDYQSYNFFSKEESEQQILSKRAGKNRLYLNVAAEFNFEPLLIVYEWFRQYLIISVDAEDLDFGETIRHLRSTGEDQDQEELLGKLLHVTDLGISGIDIAMRKLTKDNAPEEIPEEFREHFAKEFADKITPIETKLFHSVQLENGKVEQFSLNIREESSGTQRLLDIMGTIVQVLKKGKVLVIDELENSLHPEICEFITSLFQDEEHNPNQAQLIFTTHNTHLLTGPLRRDQIWLAEKNMKNQSSDLYSLVEFKARKDENFEKGYLAGRYGATPNVFSGVKLWEEE